MWIIFDTPNISFVKALQKTQGDAQTRKGIQSEIIMD